MTKWTYREAIRQALVDEMNTDGNVVLLGEDIGAAGGVFGVTKGLFEMFGPRRVRDTPISEQAIIGCATGAAMTGARPVAEIMFADFAAVCYDQLANQLAKHRYLTGGQAELPVTVRLANGAGSGFGAQHSQPVENWFLNHPGIKIAVPATPGDAYGVLRSAIRDPNPVLVFEHKKLYPMKDDQREKTIMPLGRGRVVRTGRHATVVATQAVLHNAIAAWDVLAREGIGVTVIDPVTLVPLDIELIAESVRDTGRLVCVMEGNQPGSWGEHVIAQVVGAAFDHLDVPPCLVSSPGTPVPYAASLEDAWVPNVAPIVGAVRTAATA